MIRVLLADDHAIFRRGLKDILTEAFKKVVFGEANTARQAIEHIRAQNWDLAILDISMPGRSGLDILEDIKLIQPKLPVLFLSMHPEEQFARHALRAGAAGYLTKESIPEELTKAVRKVLTGGRYVSATLAEKLAMDLHRRTDKPLHELLSHREFQILRMIAAGKTAKEVADELALSVKTVSTYRARILEKSGMKNNAQLIRYAVENRLVE